MPEISDILAAGRGLAERSAFRGAGLAAAGGATQAGRIIYKAGNPDEGDYFQWALGFIPTGNLGSYLGVHNPVLRFAMDALLDPFQAVNLIPYSFVTKMGRAGEAGRFLTEAERLNQARKLVQLSGLAQDSGRGLELVEAVKRGDAAALRGFGDILNEADPATKAFFRGEGGKAIRDYLASPDPVKLEAGLSKQVLEGEGKAGRARSLFGAPVGQRAAYGLRTPFGLRTLLGDRELVLLRGGAFAEHVLEKTPYLGRWLENLGSGKVRNLAKMVDRADAATEAHHAVEALQIPVAEMAQGRPEFIPLEREARKLAEEVRPLNAEYQAARTANRVKHLDLRTLNDWADRSERALVADLTAGRGDAALAAHMAETAAVAGGNDMGPHLQPFLQRRVQTYQRIADLVPGEYRRLVADYAGKLEKAAADTVHSAEQAGPDVLRDLLAGQRMARETEAASLRAGVIPEARAAEPSVLKTVREKAAQTPQGPLTKEVAAGAEQAAKVEEAVTGASEAEQFAIRRGKLAGAAAKGLEAGADFLSKLDAALPSEASKLVPEADRIAVAGERLSAAVDRAGARLPELARMARALSGSGKLDVEPLVQALNRHLAEAAEAIGVMAGGERGKAIRDAISHAWPELGAEITDMHRSWELPTHERAMEADLLAAWNPALSKDFGGSGRALRNLYGATPSPNSLAEDYFAYKAQTSYRAAQYLAQNREAWDNLASNEARSLEFMRAFKYTGEKRQAFLDGLDAREVGLFRSAERLLVGAEAIGHGRWYEHAVQGYFPIVTRPGRLGVSVYRTSLKTLGESMRGSTESRHFRPRLSETLDQLLELEKKGVLKVEKDPRKILAGYLDALTRVSANQRLFDQMGRSRGLDGLPILMARKDMGKIAKGLGLDSGFADRYLAIEGDKLPALAGMMLHRDHADVLKVFGPQTVSEVIRQDNPFWQALQRLNIGIKGGILSFSFFHAVAQAATLAMYTGLKRSANFLTSAEVFGREKGLPAVRLSGFAQLHGQAGELVEHALRHGLELDSWDKLAADAFKGFGGRVVDAINRGEKTGPGGPMRVLVSPITGLKHFNDFTHKLTWEYVHNSGKTFLYSEFLQRILKERPGIPFEQAAREAAGSANRALGGLNWTKMFGDATFRSRLQVMMLAPDWTLSNLAQARDFFVGAFAKNLRPDAAGRLPLPVRDITSPQGAGLLARRFWINWAMSAFATMQAINYATTGHFTWQNIGGPEAALKVDLGRRDEKGKPVYLSFGKQFLEPFELAMDPMKFLLGKASPLVSFTSTVFQQEDRFGNKISVPSDSTSRKVRQTLGWLGGAVLPIPFQGIQRAVKQYRAGATDSAAISLLNAGTSMFDVSIRPAALPKGEQEAQIVTPKDDLDDDLPRMLPRHLLPGIQRRYVFMRPRGE